MSQTARSPTSVSLIYTRGERDARLQSPLLHSTPDNLASQHSQETLKTTGTRAEVNSPDQEPPRR